MNCACFSLWSIAWVASSFVDDVSFVPRLSLGVLGVQRSESVFAVCFLDLSEAGSTIPKRTSGHLVVSRDGVQRSV